MSVLRADDPAALQAAAARLAEGGLVAFPTETVYGLGARADRDAAVAGIFAAKGRPADHPLIVHVADAQQAQAFCDGPLPEAAQRLVAAFWPGPLTVIVRRRAGLADAAAGGHPTIGLRCPDHPAALALLRAAAVGGVPGVAGPSANRFGRVSPTRAAHVAAEFGPQLMVLDGGDCAVGIESAIVDCSRSQPVLLRPGALGREALAAALGHPLAQLAPPLPAATVLAGSDDTPRAPGLLASHYAPDARLQLMSGAQLRATLDELCRADTSASRAPSTLAVYSRDPEHARAGLRGLMWRPMPADAAAAARELFAVLRELDAAGAVDIWVQTPPDDPLWDGVRDRLQRAAAPRPVTEPPAPDAPPAAPVPKGAEPSPAPANRPPLDTR